MNLKVRMLQENIYALLNESDLPVEVKRLILKEVYQTVFNASEKEIEKEIAQNAENAPKH